MTTLVEPPPTGAGSSGNPMFKNNLQQYAQKSGVPLPSYSTINEGEPHAPKFRATVLVDGIRYTSPNTFSHRKEAEQDIAKFALESIMVKFKNEGSTIINKDPIFCKLILYEYGSKLKIDKPTYSTVRQGTDSIFVTTVTFDANTYSGYAGVTKKAAEQNAARAIIDSILANSSTSILMAQIIKTKCRLYSAVSNNVNAGVAAMKFEIGSGSASLPAGSTSLAPCIQNNPLNYQIPASADFIHLLGKRKKSKKRKSDHVKRPKVEEQ